MCYRVYHDIRLVLVTNSRALPPPPPVCTQYLCLYTLCTCLISPIGEHAVGRARACTARNQITWGGGGGLEGVGNDSVGGGEGVRVRPITHTPLIGSLITPGAG